MAQTRRPLLRSSRFSVNSPRMQSATMMSHFQPLPTLKPTKTYLVRDDTLTYPAYSSGPSFENSLRLFRLSTRVPTSYLLYPPIPGLSATSLRMKSSAWEGSEVLSTSEHVCRRHQSCAATYRPLTSGKRHIEHCRVSTGSQSEERLYMISTTTGQASTEC